MNPHKRWEGKQIRHHSDTSFIDNMGSLEEQVERFIVDSGCTHHMTNKLAILDNYSSMEPQDIRIADNQAIMAIGVGTIQTDFMFLKSVYFVPKLKVPLLSVYALAEDGYKVSRIRMVSQSVPGQARW